MFALSSTALEKVSDMPEMLGIVKCFRKYSGLPGGFKVAGAGSEVVVRIGRRVADVSPPVKPPGPESQAESSKAAVSQPSASWQLVSYFQVSLYGKTWVNVCAVAVVREPVRQAIAVRVRRSFFIGC